MKLAYMNYKNTLLAMIGAAALAGSNNASALTTIDLVNGNTGTANNTIYNWVDQQTTGTGVIEPFLRVQASGSGAMEQGYNNDVGTPWDTKAGIWTHDLQKSDLVTVTIGGVSYYEFLLDINQNQGGNNELLSLNNVQIYSRSTQIASAPDDFSQLGTLRYNNDQVGGLGAANDVTVELDYSRNPGSGAGDMLMYVRTDLFNAVAATDYIYFYSLFGNPNDANDGFEEWALVRGPTTVPDAGSTVALLGMAMMGLGLLRRRIS